MFFKETNIFPSGGESNFRIPTIVTTKHGTTLAFVNDRRNTCSDHADEQHVVLCRKPLNGEWEGVRTLAANSGWNCMIHNAVYDSITDTVFCGFTRKLALDEFGNYSKEELEQHAKQESELAQAGGFSIGQILLCSTDDGLTWSETPMVCQPTVMPNGQELIGWGHGGGPGVQLQHGPHAGRLLCPGRFMTGRYTTWEELKIYCYNNALYSDDHGKTWVSSNPVQQGTGEGTLIERGDGSILYNSRAYYGDRKRYLATSTDGGANFGDFRTDDYLLDTRGSCNGCLLRVERQDLTTPELLPTDAAAITLFSNPRSENRDTMTVCVSFDDGDTWQHSKLIWPDACAYSALTYNPATGLFCLLYEKGKTNPYEFGLMAAEFDLEWLLS